MLPPLSVEQAIETTVREEWGRILAALVRSLGDFQLAEDCLQDAITIAMTDWAKRGLPRSPAAWLITTARRKAIDRLRFEALRTKKQSEISYLADLENRFTDETVSDAIPDKRLEMIFTCCHPALEEKTRIALTLRTLGGLTTEEIAKAFLDRPEAMAQRLVRAKKKIKLAGIPYQIPSAEDLPQRISTVLSVIYLIFNEGYSTSCGTSPSRTDLVQEAIRLTRIMQQLLPEETEVDGLLALMLLHDSRRYTRSDDSGNLVALENQNRLRWDKGKINEGAKILKSVLPKGRVGPYQLQAAISAVHAQSPSWKQTDWAQIAALYELLYSIKPSPVIRINQAVALSFSTSLTAGLEVLKSTENSRELENYQPFFAAKADLLLRSGDRKEAKVCLDRAIFLSNNTAEREFLRSKAKDFGLEC